MLIGLLEAMVLQVINDLSMVLKNLVQNYMSFVFLSVYPHKYVAWAIDSVLEVFTSGCLIVDLKTYAETLRHQMSSANIGDR
jgi:hypothetical protein